MRMGFMSCFDWLAVGAISRGDEAADRMRVPSMARKLEVNP